MWPEFIFNKVMFCSVLFSKSTVSLSMELHKIFIFTEKRRLGMILNTIPMYIRGKYSFKQNNGKSIIAFSCNINFLVFLDQNHKVDNLFVQICFALCPML